MRATCRPVVGPEGGVKLTERRIARAAAASDPESIHAALAAAGYLPDPRAFAPGRVLSQIRTAGEWYFTPGFRRLSPGYIADLMERSSSPRSDFYEEMRQETVPPQALLIRRMEGLVLAVLGELRAGADWGALAAEYFAGTAPATPLGELDAAFWTNDGLARRAGAA